VATAPVAQEPNPVEIANWQAGRNNARSQYTQQLAAGNFGRTQANLANDIAMRQQQFNQGQQRRTIDDPYLARGVFRSGIRNQGLSDFYTQNANEQANRQQQYLAQMGGYYLQDQNALDTMNTSLANLEAQELARRAQLAAEIKGIV